MFNIGLKEVVIIIVIILVIIGLNKIPAFSKKVAATTKQIKKVFKK